MRSHSSAALVGVVLFVASATAQLPEPELRLNEDNRFELTAFGQEFARISITSRSPSWLRTGGDPGPFSHVSVDGGHHHSDVMFEVSADETKGVAIDGTIQLDAWPFSPRPGEIFGFRYATLQPVDRPDGLGFTGSVNEDGFIVVSGTGQDVIAMSFSSPNGKLVPAAETARSAEFPLQVTNSPTNILLGAPLGTSVTIDGDVTLPIGFNGDDPTSEILAEYGVPGSTDPIRFLVEGDVWEPEFLLNWSEYQTVVFNAEGVPKLDVADPIEELLEDPLPVVDIETPEVQNDFADPTPSIPTNSDLLGAGTDLGNVNSLSAPVVPEPSTDVSLIVALACLHAMRRKRTS